MKGDYIEILGNKPARPVYVPGSHTRPREKGFLMVV